MLTVALFAFSCSEDTTRPDDEDALPGTPFQTSNIKDEPVLFDFGTGSSVATGWDIKFLADSNNFGSPDIALNSGLNGSMGVQIINLDSVDYDAATVPDSGFNVDSDTLVVGGRWYNYNFVTNDIITKGEVFIIKGWNYTTIKFTLLDYLNSKFHIKYSLLGADDTWGSAVIDSFVVTSDAPVYYEFLTGNELSSKPDWDLAFATVLVDAGPAGFIPSPGARLNSVSGVEIAIVADSSFDKIISVPATAQFSTDLGETLALGDRILYYTGAPDHLVIGNGDIYLIKTVEGDVFKFQIDSYYQDPDLPGENSGYVSFRYEKF